MRAVMLALTAGSAAWLVPWSGYLARSLPNAHDTDQWRLAWVGFDVALLCCFAACAWLGWRRRRSAVPLMVVTAALMCCDAWFDVVLDWDGPDRLGSLAMAVLVEVPLAVWLLLRARRMVVGDTVPKRVSMREIDEVLTNSVCQRVMEALGDGEPRDAAAIAGALRIPPGEVEVALRALARYGHVRAERAGRWRTHPVNLHMPELADIDPADRDRYRAFMDAKYEHELRLFVRAARHRYHLGGCGKGSRGSAYLTETELARFYEEYMELLLRYSLLHDRPGPAVRPVALRFYAFPGDLPETPEDARVPALATSVH